MSDKPIQATCDAGCKKVFSINKLKTKLVKNGIEKTYFRCPHCKHEYIAFYANQETKKLQKKMRKLHGSVKEMDEQTLATLSKKETELKALIKQSMDEARRIVEREE
ncbi:hypothetical protein NST02_18330 [Robertmurraya sp. FSL W8-0741]|uniref:hypothetical protein n=1 Tax=Robertmurraya sp. FSL W8-0741 TaxID=2954629 RepID=UPI0030F4E652